MNFYIIILNNGNIIMENNLKKAKLIARINLLSNRDIVGSMCIINKLKRQLRKLG